jgi:hypothetical protein
MMALGFEIYGAVCFFSLIAFLILASVAKLRPDLDEANDEFEKLRKGASSAQLGNALPVEESIVEILSGSAPPRSVKPIKRVIRRRPFLTHKHKPRAI